MPENASDVYDPCERVQREAHVKDMDSYHKMYKLSLEDPEKFWSEIAGQFYFKSNTTGECLPRITES